MCDEFQEKLLDTFKKVKTDQRHYIEVTCMDDIDHVYSIEIGQSFQDYMYHLSIGVVMSQWCIENTFETVLNFIETLYDQFLRLTFIDTYKELAEKS